MAGYVFKSYSDKVFPQPPIGFDDPNIPLVNVPGEAMNVGDGRTMMLGAKELCGLEIVEMDGNLYRKRLPTPVEWQALASKFGKQSYSTRSGNLLTTNL